MSGNGGNGGFLCHRLGPQAGTIRGFEQHSPSDSATDSEFLWVERSAVTPSLFGPAFLFSDQTLDDLVPSFLYASTPSDKSSSQTWEILLASVDDLVAPFRRDVKGKEILSRLGFLLPVL